VRLAKMVTYQRISFGRIKCLLVVLSIARYVVGRWINSEKLLHMLAIKLFLIYGATVITEIEAKIQARNAVSFEKFISSCYSTT
jgi:hypothetical protein